MKNQVMDEWAETLDLWFQCDEMVKGVIIEDTLLKGKEITKKDILKYW